MTELNLSPEELLAELGIEQPEDIDVEAIAQYCGATVVYEPLEGSEARILGYGDQAFITVNLSSSRPRQRFSAAHELGHWMRDRGKIAHFVCTDRQLVSAWSRDDPEKRANRYAAELLLPGSMFREAARGMAMTFESVRMLGDAFQTSLTATAIRLVEEGSFPSMLICCEPGGKRWKWHLQGPDVPRELWPVDLPGRGTIASGMLNGGPARGPCEVGAWGWFVHPDADRYSVHEDSIQIPGCVLTLLWWKDESQLLDLVRD